MHAPVQVAVLLTRIQSTGNPGLHIRKRLLLELASERATSRWQILLKDPTTSTKWTSLTSHHILAAKIAYQEIN
jgi:amino acid permease